ncbi:MAG: M28 family metallopeptidase [Thermoanaerobaculia bacterium]|nr:M28 family metallopeptidase [Thermoanaerobaculia bacterium]
MMLGRIAIASSLLFALPPAPPRGFFPETAAAHRTVEERYRALPDPAAMRDAMRILAAEPHHLGSAQGEKNARWILDRFREWGLDASIETFHVLFPTPKERLVEMLEPTRVRAALGEPALPEDPTSAQTDRQLPTYNAYSIDGDVTGPLVYVNYGVPADYKRLEKLGVDVRGKIVIARYGGSWRGIKPKVAAEKGAVGCLIYSDPRDDGYFEGDVYPRGPFRSSGGVQRGSVKDMAVHPGDALTPGVGATKDARRLDRKDAKTLTKIPVLPISYGDAQPLLAALGGPVAPAEWRGALPITYHVGPGPARVRLKVAFDWNIVPLHNVIARIPGSRYPDEWVMHGNHHDAWVNGAEDPVSGLVALLEEARALGTLRQGGWKPRRTILLAAWDGEEQGLLGSTEWVELHADELRRKAVAYINTDSNGRGFLSAGGSHSLESLVNEAAREIQDPEKKISVWERMRLKKIADARSNEDRRGIRDRADVAIDALGSGSDFTPFLQHLGIASLNVGFGGEDDGGIYHSIYDDLSWYSRFSDADHAYGRALAQLTGTLLLRLSEADVLPFEFRRLSETVGKYVQEVSDLARDARDSAKENARQAEERLAWAVADPKKPFVAPVPDVPVPHFDFSELENASGALARAAGEYENALEDAAARRPPESRLAEANRILLGVERALTRPEGLPRRDWFKHHVYAPGLYTGYAVKTLPSVREAIEEKRWDEVNREAERVAAVLEKAASEITAAARLLAPARPATVAPTLR